MILVYVVCYNQSEATKIARVILHKRLAACANIFPVNSLYWWKAKIMADQETVLLLKTSHNKFSPIEKEILKIHQYKIPAIFTIPVGQVNKRYNLWLKKNLKK